MRRTCPEYFSQRLLNGVCEACGFEPAALSLSVEINFDCQSPTNTLHAGGELGSELNYQAVGFVNHGMVVKRWIDRALEDPLTKGVKTQVMEELKEYYPSEIITDYAGKLTIKEIAEFRMRYPLLATSKKVRMQLARNVISGLRLLYPQLPPRSPHPVEVTRLQ